MSKLAGPKFQVSGRCAQMLRDKNDEIRQLKIDILQLKNTIKENAKTSIDLCERHSLEFGDILNLVSNNITKSYCQSFGCNNVPFSAYELKGQ